MAEYDRHTALIVVDVQNDFADPKGSLYVRGGEEVVPVANLEAQRATQAGATVVYTMDWHPPVTPHFNTHGGPWPPHCVKGTWGAEIHPDLWRAPGSECIQTGIAGEDGYSGFTVRDPLSGETSPTALDPILRARGAKRIVVLGIATEYCVKETALDAIRNGYATTLLRDGVRPVEVHEGDAERALEEMRAAGVALE